MCSRGVSFVFFFFPEIGKFICRHVVDNGFHDILPRASGQCEPADPANTVTTRLNNLLQNGGDGYVLQLCPNQVYSIQAPDRKSVV